MRSLFPKLNGYKNDLIQREIGLSLLSEVWEKKGKRKHRVEIEKMLQIEGLKYISTPRPSSKRGGGCAIVANLSMYSMEKVEVITPKSVEVTYGLLRARNTNAKFRDIIAVAFYSPPNSKKKMQLLDNMITNIHMLLTKYPKAVVVIGGDRNEMSITPLLDSIPKLRQIVTKNTCNGKVLDVLLMNIPEYYPPPTIVPPVPADNPAKGSPSDHSTVVATPLAKPGLVQHINEYSSKTCRPLPESGKLEFGQWIMQEKWDCIQPGESPDSQVEALKNKMNTKLDAIFPTKTVRVCQKDKAYINADIKKLDRLVKREYRKHGKSAKYMKLVEKYNLKMKKAAADHLNKNVRALKESDPGKAYSTLKRMGAQPGDMLDDGAFSVKSHLEANLTNKESVERIADHFSKISQEYPKINPVSLPEDVQLKLISRLDKMNIPA